MSFSVQHVAIVKRGGGDANISSAIGMLFIVCGGHKTLPKINCEVDKLLCGLCLQVSN